MSDLISREAVINLLCAIRIDDATVNGKSIKDLINELPTAYSIEKVMAELEEEREYSYADFEEYAFAYELDLNEHDDWFCQGLKRAIELVRKGGVE